MPKPLTLNKKAPNQVDTFDFGKSRKYIGKKDPFNGAEILMFRWIQNIKKLKIKNVYLERRGETV